MAGERPVRWEKNLGPGKLSVLLPKLEGEVVIHFRWASVGGVDGRLCHPFPVTPKANVSLSGTAESVLFHNGTWGGYADALVRLEQVRDEPLPTRPMSDTRAAALIVHTTGPDVLQTPAGPVGVDERASDTQLYGQWEQWGGMLVSNSYFIHHIKRRFFAPQAYADCG